MIHDSVNSLSECTAFQGSKYVWSNVPNCFSAIENQLRRGIRVLFTGTPCQVAALKQYLKKRNVQDTHLYTVDIVCHGSPNPKVWRDYVSHLEKSLILSLLIFPFGINHKGGRDTQFTQDLRMEKK